MASHTDDILFQWIEQQHKGDFGDVLDAGTGDQSLAWLTALQPKTLTAITAEGWYAEKLKKQYPQTRIVLGQWTDSSLLENEQYDVIIADYLIGALDGHSPYFQYKIIPRLKSHLRAGGRMYLVGMSPPPDDKSELAEMVRLRDACLLLGNRRCYREYPLDIVVSWLKENGFEVLATDSWRNILGPSFVDRQLKVAIESLPGFKNEELRESMRKAIEELRVRAHTRGKMAFGSDWVIASGYTGK